MADGGIGEAALYSAVVGAGTSAATGGDPMRGALMGGLTGGAMSGLGGLMGGAEAGVAGGAGGTAAGGAGGADAGIASLQAAQTAGIANADASVNPLLNAASGSHCLFRRHNSHIRHTKQG